MTTKTTNMATNHRYSRYKLFFDLDCHCERTIESAGSWSKPQLFNFNSRLHVFNNLFGMLLLLMIFYSNETVYFWCSTNTSICQYTVSYCMSRWQFDLFNQQFMLQFLRLFAFFRRPSAEETKLSIKYDFVE